MEGRSTLNRYGVLTERSQACLCLDSTSLRARQIVILLDGRAQGVSALVSRTHAYRGGRVSFALRHHV